MAIDMIVDAASLKMVDKERGDLFAVILPDRSLIVQAIESMTGADSTREQAVPGYFAITKGKPEELWIRTYDCGVFTQCRFWFVSASCPNCAGTLKVAYERFTCEECEFKA